MVYIVSATLATFFSINVSMLIWFIHFNGYIQLCNHAVVYASYYYF